MTFNNFAFYLFLAGVVFVNYLLPRGRRWMSLLLASVIFYALFDLRFVAVWFVCTLFTYGLGHTMFIAPCENQKRRWMVIGVVANLLLLFLFKYLSFFLQTLNALFASTGLSWGFTIPDIFYPIGISFFILQALSYLWDINHELLKTEPALGQFALYLAFFPKLLSGPLERPAHFLAQVSEPEPFRYQKFIDSLLRIGIGLFKKLVIADRLALVAGTVFASPTDFTYPQVLMGVLSFSFQIYLDFSAYTDVAIGVSSLLGFELVENFNRPYLADSVTEFWRRWHMSFSNWLRDYVFMPMEIRDRRKKPRDFWISVHILLTFLISGLWHGASWTFIVWGALHGLYQIGEHWAHLIGGKSRRGQAAQLGPVQRVLHAILTFSLVSLAWIFFKADSLSTAWVILRTLFTFKSVFEPGAWVFLDGGLGLDAKDFVLMLAALAAFLLIEGLSGKREIEMFLQRQPIWLRWICYYGLFFAITVLGFYGETSGADFVYSQF